MQSRRDSATLATLKALPYIRFIGRGAAGPSTRGFMWPSILLALNLATQPAPCWVTAESWAVVADRDDYSFRVLMNPDTVSLRNSFVSAWMLYDFSTPQTSDSALGGRYLSEKSLWIFDCPSGRTTMVSFIRYSRNFGEGRKDRFCLRACAGIAHGVVPQGFGGKRTIWKRRQAASHFRARR
jgi:hypothetical protein